MKLKAILSEPYYKGKLVNAIVTASILMASPLSLLAQIEPPPPNDNGGGVDVPFDSNMNLMFLAAGVLFAVFITVRQLRKRANTAS